MKKILLTLTISLVYFFAFFTPYLYYYMPQTPIQWGDMIEAGVYHLLIAIMCGLTVGFLWTILRERWGSSQDEKDDENNNAL